MSTGYGPQVGKSPEGFPVYIYTDPTTKLRTYVVVLPDSRAFYCDEHGRLVSTPKDASPVIEVLALAGGVLGFLAGSAPGAILGGILGAAVGKALKNRAQ